jgi:ATP-dependent Clp protease ATP-binding subunit ClpC
MQKETLLNMLAPEARAAFDRARKLACSHGGVLSPLHLVIALLQEHSVSAEPGAECALLLTVTLGALAARYPASSQSIVVPKDTQSVIADADRLARVSGGEAAAPAHLLRAALASPSLKEVLGDTVQYEPALAEFELSSSRRPSPGERAETREARPEGQNRAEEAPPVRTLTGVLREYCSDLAEESRSASAHPFIGRDREITAVLETLCRKLKNNPLLIGKPGVGKTALVAAVSARLCEGVVPPRLQGKRVLEVSRLRLLADAKFAGEIEERLNKLLEEVRRAGDCILFFDEIHNLLSAGGSGGTGDVANLLKSSLSKGELTCIGATTLAEYYKYIARDEALARRFSTITIEEPSSEETRRILTLSRMSFESYHGVRIDDDVIGIIVDMADRYLHSRSFPDKAFDLLDRAAAKATLAGDDRLTRESVTETLSETTGLPLEIMDEDPSVRLERLEEFLNSQVPGQQRAARDVARVARIAKLKLELRPEQPDGVFLFVGPEGVGKHEMAAGLAKFLYGSMQKMIEFEMSQFTEAHSISRLVGAEPGYVGYGDRSGLLSKAAEDNPHSVLYFKNIDLAHPVVQQFLGEAFEQGRFTDAAGARISLSNITVVMSLSQISENQKLVHVGFSARKDEDEERRTGGLRPSTGSLNRERGQGSLAESLAVAIDEVVEFQVLDRSATERIISERLEALGARLEAAQPIVIRMDPALASFFADRLAAERKSLAQLERLWQETIVIPFTNLHVDRRAIGARPEVTVKVEAGSVRVGMHYGNGLPSAL